MTDGLHPTGAEQAPVSSDPNVDGTLGGYFSHHNRPPGFEGSDGHPYTVSIEVEKTPNLSAPFSGYLIFPKWAATGVGIVGHLESSILLEERSPVAAKTALGALTLFEVQRLLEVAILQEISDKNPTRTNNAGNE